ncbi:TPA: hypothetical protein ACH3X2_009170 [Trebouxia sp. C0005]
MAALFGGRARLLRDFGFFDVASTRILSVDVPGNPKLSVYYQVNSASDATKFQTYKGPMTLLDHQEFRFYEQEPAGVRITVGLRESGGQPIASGEYVVQGDEAGLPIAVHLQDSTGREIAQIVFLLSCAPGWGISQGPSLGDRIKKTKNKAVQADPSQFHVQQAGHTAMTL